MISPTSASQLRPSEGPNRGCVTRQVWSRSDDRANANAATSENGVEDFQEITIRHSKYAASRFAHEAAPALSRFAESSPAPFIDGIRAAREKIVARSDEDRQDFLRKRGFSRAETGRIVETVLAEEGRPPESVFDFVQGITAVARSKPQQDARLVMEGKAKGLLENAVQ